MPSTGQTTQRWSRLRAALTVLGGIVHPWSLECDCCGEELGARRPFGRGRTFIRRDAGDDAARDAGWDIGERDDGKEFIFCPSCLPHRQHLTVIDEVQKYLGQEERA